MSLRLYRIFEFKPDSQSAAEFKEELIKLTPLSEAVYFTSKASKLEVIRVKEVERGEIVLLHSELVPEFAWLIWNDSEIATRWQISLNLKYGSELNRPLPPYALVCLCCGLKGGFKEHLSVGTQIKRNIEAIDAVCSLHKIKALFVRQADDSLAKNFQVKLIEGNKYLESLSLFYKPEIVTQALSFINKEKSHFS